MYHSFRLLRFGQNLNKIRWPLPGRCNMEPLASTRVSSPQIQTRSSTTTPPKSEKEESYEDKIKGKDIFYVKFKDNDIKKMFKDLYSLYGPLFVGCHIAISLCSLGFFYSIVWMTVDPIAYVPEFVIRYSGQYMADITNSGGKFVLAYAIHKIILPIRLGAAIWVTSRLSKAFKLKYRKKTN